MDRYLAVVFNEEIKKIEYSEIDVEESGIGLGDVAIQIINALSKHEKLINFWKLWELSIDDIEG